MSDHFTLQRTTQTKKGPAVPFIFAKKSVPTKKKKNSGKMTICSETALTDVFDVFNFKFCLTFHLDPVERTKTTLTNGFIGSYMTLTSEILSNTGYK